MAVLTAVIISRCFIILSMETWLALSLIIVMTGTYGDFFKSMLKRSLHIKDTGSILPGHGGVLDRFDSLIGSAPFVFSYLVLYGHFEI
ncbi:MAG: phosphatidate cytidylyltransferase [Mucilaginibacter sp.]